jgi:hypothetical protein
MTTDLSKVIANNMPIDNSGLLSLESNWYGGDQNKLKPKQAKKQRVKTCETATQLPTYQSKELERTTKVAFSQNKLMNCQSGEKIRLKTISSDDEYGMLTELAKRVKELERHQTTTSKKLHAEINTLARKVSDAEYRNIVMDVEIHLLKNQLNTNNEQIKRLVEKTQKYGSTESTTAETTQRRRLPRDRGQVLSKDEIVIPKGVRMYGHQRLKSTGFE